MRALCSWCYNIIESPELNDDQEVMCPDCKKWHQGATENSIKEFLEKLPVPVVSIAADNTIISANSKASDIFRLEPEKNFEKKTGELFNCKNSHSAGGCGKTVDCMKCMIRNLILTTYLDGIPRENVSVTIETDENIKARLTVSAVRVKGNVWLRFDKWMKPE
jgi:hypothetical protein